jgi:hypothetical protein
MNSAHNKWLNNDPANLVHQLEMALSESDRLDLKLAAIHIAEAIDVLKVQVHSSQNENSQ